MRKGTRWNVKTAKKITMRTGDDILYRTLLCERKKSSFSQFFFFFFGKVNRTRHKVKKEKRAR